MKKAKLILLDNPIIVTDEEIKNGDSWVYINPKEWDEPQYYTITKNNLGKEWFEKLWDKENYKKVIDKQIDYNNIDFGIVDVENEARKQYNNVGYDRTDDGTLSLYVSGVEYGHKLNEKKFSQADMIRCFYAARRYRMKNVFYFEFAKEYLDNMTPETFDIEIEETSTHIKILRKL